MGDISSDRQTPGNWIRTFHSVILTQRRNYIRRYKKLLKDLLTFSLTATLHMDMVSFYPLYYCCNISTTRLLSDISIIAKIKRIQLGLTIREILQVNRDDIVRLHLFSTDTRNGIRIVSSCLLLDSELSVSQRV